MELYWRRHAARLTTISLDKFLDAVAEDIRAAPHFLSIEGYGRTDKAPTSAAIAVAASSFRLGAACTSIRRFAAFPPRRQAYRSGISLACARCFSGFQPSRSAMPLKAPALIMREPPLAFPTVARNTPAVASRTQPAPSHFPARLHHCTPPPTRLNVTMHAESAARADDLRAFFLCVNAAASPQWLSPSPHEMPSSPLCHGYCCQSSFRASSQVYCRRRRFDIEGAAITLLLCFCDHLRYRITTHRKQPHRCQSVAASIRRFLIVGSIFFDTLVITI